MKLKALLINILNTAKVISRHLSRIKPCAEVGIYKRKQESKKTRKHDFEQDIYQEIKKKERNTLWTKKATKKKRKKTFFFLDRFLGG